MVDRRKARSDKKKFVVALLCLFFGLFGVHRFYVGKVFTGILMLLLSVSLVTSYSVATVTLIIPSISSPAIIFATFYTNPNWIWVIIDFVRIIKGSFGDKENRGLS